jgi:DNA-binding CsgD family transcriptional regulator
MEILLSTQITPRETEVLMWAARGKTSWEIATLLSISEDTARQHVKSVCRKFGVSNKTHAVAYAISEGLIKL